jgi:hypothetical protein
MPTPTLAELRTAIAVLRQKRSISLDAKSESYLMFAELNLMYQLKDLLEVKLAAYEQITIQN